MHDAHDSRIKGRIANHQQTRVYTLFAICFFQSTNLGCVYKKVRKRIFPLVMREVTALRRDCAQHNARIEVNQPLYTLHSLLIFDVFTHNLCASRIVYSRLHTYRTYAIVFILHLCMTASGLLFFELEKFFVLKRHTYFHFPILNFSIPI